MTDKLAIRRTYDVPLDVVWEAWADPNQAKAWWGPRGFSAPVVELDERVGGKWRALMIAPDGSRLWQHGVYREIVPKKRIVYTMIWDHEPDHEMLVTIDFSSQAGKTEISFEQTGFNSDGEREGHSDGWNQSFDRLGEYLDHAPAKKPRKKNQKGAAHARR
jgi:uncharacterized protein YndB with AHSA1/START domain